MRRQTEREYDMKEIMRVAVQWTKVGWGETGGGPVESGWSYSSNFFFCGATAQTRRRPPHCLGFYIIHNSTHTESRKDSSERVISSSHRPLPTQQTCFEPAMPAIKRLQTCALDRMATVISTAYYWCFFNVIIYLSWSWATCWPFPVSRIQKSLQRSTTIPSASWGVVFHYPG